MSLTESGSLNTHGSRENKSYFKAGIGVLAKTLQLPKRNKAAVQVVDPVPGMNIPRKEPELLCSLSSASSTQGTGKSCRNSILSHSLTLSPASQVPKDITPWAQLLSCSCPCTPWSIPAQPGFVQFHVWDQQQLKAQLHAGFGHSGLAVATGQGDTATSWGLQQPQPLLTQRSG